MKRFISFSGGVESTTMCVLYGKGATALWCDTGEEENELYERVDYVEQKLKELHEGNFELIKIHPKVIVKGVEVTSISGAAMVWGIWPSAVVRYCTGKFKIEPIDEFLSQQGDCELMIGFNADEEPGKDRTGNFMKCKNVHYTYPLHADGHDRSYCENILHSLDLHPNFPPYMSRGGCKWCYYKTKAELKAKCIFNRGGFIEDMQLEEFSNAVGTRKKFYTINMNAGRYADIMKEVDNEISMWGIEAVKSMYKNTQAHKPCGAFCHR